MATTELVVPDVELTDSGLRIKQIADSIVIDDAQSQAQAGGVLRDIAYQIEAIHTAYDSICTKAFEAHRHVTGIRKGFLEQREYAKKMIGAKLATYQQEVDRAHRKEQDRLQAIARKYAEDEQLRQAEQLEAEGRKGEAEAVIAAPVVAPVVAIPPPPKSDAVTVREYWRAIVVNKSLLPAEWLIPNESELNKFAQRTKGAIAIPGVVFEKEIRGAMKPRR